MDVEMIHDTRGDIIAKPLLAVKTSPEINFTSCHRYQVLHIVNSFPWEITCRLIRRLELSIFLLSIVTNTYI
ncbi:hypothetical protein FQR65_LT12438 [Abscondita terminalis]|nr:hypothetical protein FQR65_LT12438 [Abscondita terminalis]